MLQCNSKSLELSLQQEVWPPGSADTVCPSQPLMTGTALFPGLRRGTYETYR